jgi:hypothetical protein
LPAHLCSDIPKRKNYYVIFLKIKVIQ